MSKNDNSKHNSQFVLVSNQLIGPESVEVGFAFRTEALNSEDSGWNFWSGNETEAYIKNPDNFSRYPLKHFLDLDPSLADLIKAEVDSTWERDEESEEWVEVLD